LSGVSIALTFATLLMVSGSALADQFTFTSPGTVTWDGVYVNPYQATDNTQPQNNPLTIYCDDWNTEFSGNPTWSADVYALTAGNVQYLKYGGITSAEAVTIASGVLSASAYSNPKVYDLYLEAAYLDSKLEAVLASKPVNTTLQEEYAAANWLLFVNSANVGGLIGAINGSGTAFATAVYNDLASAQTIVNANGFNPAGWDVIVPANSNSFAMQEFLVDPVPEPRAVILFGTVIWLLGLLEFRRLAQGVADRALAQTLAEGRERTGARSRSTVVSRRL